MCGIAGWLCKPSSALEPDYLQKMIQAISHRGPDGTGMELLEAADGHHIALGHCRLAIIDPAGGHQPMVADDAGIVLVFNGEIYNFRELRSSLVSLGYQFTSDSDTEVLLRAWQAWGEEALLKLRGMFAFAIWDTRRQVLFLARDAFGKKPLFLWQQDEDIFFASEMKAFTKLPMFPRQINEQALWDYVTHRYVPGPQTLYRNVLKLMPGSSLKWVNGRWSHHRWFAPKDYFIEEAQEPEDVESEFMALLNQAVQRRMISDVPFGAFLSGGIDSSAIVALMSQNAQRPIHTFAVGFTDSEKSELDYARIVAAHFKTNHEECIIHAREIIDWLPKVTQLRDAPANEPADVPMFLMARCASRKVKMVLTGEGSDEVLAGYPKYLAEHWGTYWRLLPEAFRNYFIEKVVNHLPYRYQRIKTALTSLSTANEEERFIRWFGAVSFKERKLLVKTALHQNQHRLAQDTDWQCASVSAIKHMLCFDQTRWLPDNLLERGDRMTMGASIEARMPFLDQDLAGYLARLPDKYKIRGLTTKWLLRQSMKDILPEAILKRPKNGFHVPIAAWFRGPLREWLHDQILSAGSFTRANFEKDYLDMIVREHSMGINNHEKLLWTLVTLEVWHQQCVLQGQSPV